MISLKVKRAMGLAVLLALVFGGNGISRASEEELAYKHLLRAGDLKKEGDFAGAVKEYRAAWKLAEIPEALLEMARLLNYYFNKNAKAIKLYRVFLKKFPNDRQARKAGREMKKAKNQLKIEGSWKADLNDMEAVALTPLKPLPRAHTRKKTILMDKKAEEALKLAAETFTGLPSTCLGCHAGVMGPKINMDATHPVGRIPKGRLAQTVPLDVRFYREGRVICLSCHNPRIIHLSEGNPQKVYKYLRVDTHDGEDLVLFCGMCHARKVSPNSFRRMGLGGKREGEPEIELEEISRGREEFQEEDEVDEDFFAD